MFEISSWEIDDYATMEAMPMVIGPGRQARLRNLPRKAGDDGTAKNAKARSKR